MRNTSLTNFYNLVQSNTGSNLRNVMLVPFFMLLTTISAFSQLTTTFSCDDDCEGFVQVGLCIEVAAANPPVYLSAGFFDYKPIAGSCPVPLSSWGPMEHVFVNTGGNTYCYDGLYMQYGETIQYVIADAVNNPIAAMDSNGSITAPDAPSLAISGPAEACFGSEGLAEFVPTITSEAAAGDACALTLDPAARYFSFMNVSDNPNGAPAGQICPDGVNNDGIDGSYCFGVFDWGYNGTDHPDLGATLNGTGFTLTSPPLDDPSIYWYDSGAGGPGELGNNIMEANHYIEDQSGQYAGKEITYAVEVTAMTFSCGQTTSLYIREFNAGFAGIAGEHFVPITGPGVYSVTLSIGAGAIVQYGHQTVGPNVWSTDVAGCGSIDLSPTTPLVGGVGTWSVQDASGLQIETGTATNSQPSSFTFAGEGDYTIELLYDFDLGGETCTARTSLPFSITDPSDGELDGDTYVCEGDAISTYFFDYDGALDCTPVYTLADVNGADVSALLVPNATGGVGVNWPANADLDSPYTLSMDCTGGTCNFAAPETLEITFSDGSASSMACNNLVNITLNQNCELIITPDMILEGTDDDDDRFTVVVTDIATGVELPDVLDYSHVGNTYQVMVIEDCSFNSCWGYIKVEDKGIPSLECPEDAIVNCEQIYDYTLTGFPVFDLTVTVTPTAGNNGSTSDTWLVAGFDNCTDATLSYTDAIDSESCEPGEPGTVLARTWTITDAVGHSSSCTQLVSVIRPDVNSIQGPLSWDDNIAGANPSLDICLKDANGDDIPLDENGNPHPSYTGYPQGLFCMNVTLKGYDDVRELEKCGPGSDARKIIREWLLHEACTGEIVTLTQIITIADHAAPVTTCPLDNINVDADPYDCGTEVDIYPYPGSNQLGMILQLIECSDFTIEVFYKAALPGTILESTDDFTSLGFVDSVTDFVTIPATDGLRVWVTYLVEDACGNTAFANAINQSGDPLASDLVSCFYEINYVDVTPPQPVCDLYSVVSVGANGCTKAGPQSFNDFSHDNCSDELTFGVVRMDEFNASNPNYGDLVEFCCDDVSETVPVMVILNVTDEEGNSSSCMVEVTVKDPISPNLTFCPGDITVDCEDSRLSDYSNFGTPTFTDNCGATLTQNDDIVSINECGVGSIRRSWSLADGSGNLGQSCSQTITVTNSTPYAIADADFPDDTTIGCNDSTDPSATGEPTINAIGCSNVLYSYDDTRFSSLTGSLYCEKILRKWTVIDWCNQGNTTVHTQVIKIEDNAIPVILCPTADVSGDLILGSCTKQVDLVASATDDCTAADELIMYYSVDNGSLNAGNDASGAYSLGSHTVTFYAEDNCGNIGECSVSFNIEDSILPTPYCLQEVVTVISAASGTAEIWAEDLNAGSFDNCYEGSGDVVVSFSPTAGDLVRYFDCDDLANGIVDTFSVNVYAIDSDGNYDFCTALVIVQDNNDLCPDVPDSNDEGSNRIAISGEVATEYNEALEDVMVSLHANLPEYPEEAMSTNGDYMFDDLPSDESYMVTAQKNDAHANGVSTLDIILIQRHILNLQNLDSPYKLIAADADNNGYVSAADLVDIRKLILEVYSEYPSNESWRFVKSDFVFLDATQPFPFEEEVNLLDLDVDAAVDFTAVKIGDVNKSVVLNLAQGGGVESRGNNPLQLQTVIKQSSNGGTYLELVASESYEFIGLQMGITAGTAIETIGDGVLDLRDDNVNLTQSENGQVYLSWNSQSATRVNAGDVLFTVGLNAEASTELRLDETTFATEVYTTADNGEITIEPIVINGLSTDTEFVLHQNKPNPFSESTMISFSLPTTQSATLSIMDVTGKVVYSVTDTYGKGFNEVVFNTSLVNTTGILYYQIETETHSSTKKMVILK